MMWFPTQRAPPATSPATGVRHVAVRSHAHSETVSIAKDGLANRRAGTNATISNFLILFMIILPNIDILRSWWL